MKYEKDEIQRIIFHYYFKYNFNLRVYNLGEGYDAAIEFNNNVYVYIDIYKRYNEYVFYEKKYFNANDPTEEYIEKEYYTDSIDKIYELLVLVIESILPPKINY